MKKFLLLFLSVTLVIALGACGGGQTPDQAVSEAMDAIKAGDKAAASKYLDYEELFDGADAADTKKMEELLVKNLSYKIVSTKSKGDTATVKTEITNIDMSTLFPEFITRMFEMVFSGIGEHEMETKSMELFAQLMSRSENTKVTTVVDIDLSKEDGAWEISMSDEFLDAIFGGMVSVAEQISNSFDSAQDKNDKNDINDINDIND